MAKVFVELSDGDSVQKRGLIEISRENYEKLEKIREDTEIASGRKTTIDDVLFELTYGRY
jgi:hypothetical protein